MTISLFFGWCFLFVGNIDVVLHEVNIEGFKSFLCSSVIAHLGDGLA